MSAELMACISAIVVALMDILRKKGLLRSDIKTGLLISILANFIVFWLLVLLFATTELRELNVRVLLFLISSGILGTFIARGFNFLGNERIGPSKTRSLTSSRPLFSTLLAISFLSETINVPVFAGMLLVVLGTVCCSLEDDRMREPQLNKDLIFPVLAALFFSLADVLRKDALRTTGVIVANAINSTAALVGLTSFLALSRGTRVSFDRRSFVWFFVAGIGLSLAMLLGWEALRTGTISSVTPIMNTTPVFTLIFSYLLLRDVERITPVNVVGVIMVVTGAAAITIF